MPVQENSKNYLVKIEDQNKIIYYLNNSSSHDGVPGKVDIVDFVFKKEPLQLVEKTRESKRSGENSDIFTLTCK